jgi:hypothetical protein
MIEWLVSYIFIDMKSAYVKFIVQHPDFKAYEHKSLDVSTLPRYFSGSLEGFLCSQAQSNAQQLRLIMESIAKTVLMAVPTDWSWDYLIQSLNNYTVALCKLDFPNVMDFFADASLSFSICDLNEFLAKQKIGYELDTDGTWVLKDGTDSRVLVITQSVESVAEICNQAASHLEQAKQNLIQSTDRANKDAIRDCISAMESLLKKISNKKDVDDAITELKKSRWGTEEIIEEGKFLWIKIHKLKDIRHGNPVKSNISDAEALYWVERIICFVNYISRMHLLNV